jgi:hypothetical protein
MATGDKNQPKTPAAKAEKFSYTVRSRLDHDGETYEPGSTVELTEAQAAPMLGGALEIPQ